ncbi:hypothetical protein ES705_34911 [subsurface metagenome]
MPPPLAPMEFHPIFRVKSPMPTPTSIGIIALLFMSCSLDSCYVAHFAECNSSSSFKPL